MLRKILLVLLIIILIIPAILSLFHPGFFLSDDGTWMIVRFSAFYDALRHGEFPVRFLPRVNFGYGYPVADFLYPLFLYIGVPIRLLGFNFFTTIKIILGLSLFLSGICSFFWLRTKYSEESSVIGAIVYTLFPYHLWDIYKRGSVGEALALAIVPFIFWQIERKNIALGGIGIGLLILAHNVVALLFLPVIFLYALLKKNYFTDLCVIFFIGLGISAFFWFPALIDKQYTIFDKTAVSDFNKYFLGVNDFILFGFISLLTFAYSLYLIILNFFHFSISTVGSSRVDYSLQKKKDENFSFILLFWIVSAVSIFLTLSISHIIWQYVPGTSLIQFPFRFLSLTTLGIAFLAASSVEDILARQAGKAGGQKKYLWIVGIVYISIVYISAWTLFSPKKFQDFPDTFYTTNFNSTTVQNEYMPIWVKQLPTTLPLEKVKIIQGKGQVANLSSRGNNLQFEANVIKNSIVQINTIYFPGWKVFVDRREVEIFYDNSYGVIQFFISPGNHTIQARFTETSVRLTSDFISGLAVMFTIAYFIIERRQYKLKSKII